MKRVLWVPLGTAQQPEIIDLDVEYGELSDWTSDPYRVWQAIAIAKEPTLTMDTVAFAEKVDTPWPNTKLFVHDGGQLIGQPANRLSYVMYPGPLVGDIMVCKVEDYMETDDEGFPSPNFRIVDRDWESILESLLIITKLD